MIRRRFLAAGLQMAAAGSCVAAPQGRRKATREVLAFYYGWYGDAADKADWGKVDSAARRIDKAADYPLAGAYSSKDPALVSDQMREMRACGITSIIYSWWGIGSYEDLHFPLIIQCARAQGLKVTVYYEMCPKIGGAASADAVQADLDYLIGKYAGAANWLTEDGRKVVFIYGYAWRQLKLEDWRAIIGEARRTYAGRVFFSVAAENAAGLDFVDSIHRYALVASAGERPPDQMNAWAMTFYAQYLKEQARYPIKTLTVYPGYDDTHLHRAKTLATGRFDGALYETLWSCAVRRGPDWILITSWNEWHEGTEIEPSVQYGDLFLRLTARYAKPFLDGP
jgi:hypothetical protein